MKNLKNDFIPSFYFFDFKLHQNYIGRIPRIWHSILFGFSIATYIKKDQFTTSNLTSISWYPFITPSEELRRELDSICFVNIKFCPREKDLRWKVPRLVHGIPPRKKLTKLADTFKFQSVFPFLRVFRPISSRTVSLSLT